MPAPHREDKVSKKQHSEGKVGILRSGTERWALGRGNPKSKAGNHHSCSFQDLLRIPSIGLSIGTPIPGVYSKALTHLQKLSVSGTTTFLRDQGSKGLKAWWEKMTYTSSNAAFVQQYVFILGQWQVAARCGPCSHHCELILFRVFKDRGA